MEIDVQAPVHAFYGPVRAHDSAQQGRVGRGQWVDISGLIAPKSEVDAVIEDIEKGVLTDVQALNSRFSVMHANYYTYECTWAYDRIQ